MGGYGFHFWMSDISQNPEHIDGINSHGFEGFLNFFGCVCGGSGADWIATALLLCGLWGVWRRVDPACRGYVGIIRAIPPLSDYLLITIVLKVSQEPQYMRGFT